MTATEHPERFWGDDPYLICDCGQMRDAMTGCVLREGDGRCGVGDPTWRAQFAPKSELSVKVRCITCGRTGYPGVRTPSAWQMKCLAGHPHRCEDCDRWFSCRSGLSAHTHPRRAVAP